MGKRGPRKGSSNAKGGIPKHKHEREVEGSVITPGNGPHIKPKKTTRYRCKTCGMSMGSETTNL